MSRSSEQPSIAVDRFDRISMHDFDRARALDQFNQAKVFVSAFFSLLRALDRTAIVSRRRFRLSTRRFRKLSHV